VNRKLAEEEREGGRGGRPVDEVDRARRGWSC